MSKSKNKKNQKNKKDNIRIIFKNNYRKQPDENVESANMCLPDNSENKAVDSFVEKESTFKDASESEQNNVVVNIEFNQKVENADEHCDVNDPVETPQVVSEQDDFSAASFVVEADSSSKVTEKKQNKFTARLKALWNYFTLYEKIWYISILVLSVIFAFVFPEEDVNGVNGTLIMIFYLADILLNITCELLISKQSKWNFIVSLGVEVVEIITLIVLMSRFATMAVTIFFWIPVDIISFINWNRHKDQDEQDLTVVRTLKWWQSLVVILIVAVWTAGIGYLMARFAPDTDFYNSDQILRIVAYLDACVSVVGIFNGLFILFRFREQWLAWYIDCALETVINIISGQWVLLVLKAGYITNTTYGYVKWTKYIKQHHTVVGDEEKNLTEKSKSGIKEKLFSKVSTMLAWVIVGTLSLACFLITLVLFFL